MSWICLQVGLGTCQAGKNMHLSLKVMFGWPLSTNQECETSLFQENSPSKSDVVSDTSSASEIGSCKLFDPQTYNIVWEKLWTPSRTSLGAPKPETLNQLLLGGWLQLRRRAAHRKYFWPGRYHGCTGVKAVKSTPFWESPLCLEGEL